VEDEDKVSEIEMHYENIGAPEGKFPHKPLNSDYLSLTLKVSRLKTHVLKSDGQLKKEKHRTEPGRPRSKGWNLKALKE
jgi:hypothetical protein